jgi:hypothetical protein
MISKKDNGRFFGVLLATVYASLIVISARHLWPELHIALSCLVFVFLWIGFYLAGVWTLVDRPAELNRKLPISSQELRRRRKAFYDWLDSRGRH